MIKTVGEFETLNFSIGIIPEDIQLFHLIYRTSAKARRQIAEHLLSPKEELAIDNHYTSRTAEIFAVILKSLGLRLEFIDEDESLTAYDNETIRMHEYDGKNIMCTDYEFMLLERKLKLEKEILEKLGIVDTDELQKLIFDEMQKRNFIIGPSEDEYNDIWVFDQNL